MMINDINECIDSFLITMDDEGGTPQSGKELVPLGWFQNPQEHRLFDYMLANMNFIIDDLEIRNRMIGLGLLSSEGGNYKGSIRSTGYFVAQNDLLCKALSTIGRAKFNGLLIVNGRTMIAGRSHFMDHCMFSKKAEIAGYSTFERHILSSGKLILNGEIKVIGDIYADNPIILKGKTELGTIRSTSSISARAQIKLTGDVHAEEFVLSKGGGEVQSITAKFVSIGFKDRITAKRFHTKVGERRNIVNPIELIKYLKNTITHALSRKPKGSKVLKVHGDIIGEEVYLSNCIIMGNVKGNSVTIGPEVKIDGLIEYTEKFEIQENTDETYEHKQIANASDAK
jgi:cytoskeletal protein CcmA (bactofilin family)